MAFSKHVKQNPNSSTEPDMLNNLPDSLKQNILTYLPLTEAGRTSVISKKWRYTWASIPDLTFSLPEITPALFQTQDLYGIVMRFVDTVFLLHRGPINSCHILINLPCFCFEAYDRWILHLSRNGIREFKLDLSYSSFYLVHSSLFSCDKLRCVNLNTCHLKVPLSFEQFTHLESLVLSLVEISDHDLEKLVSGCPLLKNLILDHLIKSLELEIHAPNLEHLEINSDFIDLHVRAPKLQSLSVDKFEFYENWKDNFTQVFDEKPCLEKLTIKGNMLEFLCSKPLMGKSPLTFNRLTNLEFELDFTDDTKSSLIVALFQRASNLRSLVVHVNFSEEEEHVSPSLTFWEKMNKSEDLLNHLQKVKIINFIALLSTISFVEFILSSAPRLSSLTIKEGLDYKEDNEVMFEQFMLLPRASPKVNIKIK